MFDHRNFATSGLYPGLVSTRSVANMGHFEIEITVTPVEGHGGGGYFYSPPNVGPTKYKVKIRVTRKGRVWEYEQIVGTTAARVIAKVIKKKVAEPSVSVTNMSMVQSSEPTVKANIK